LDTTVEQQVEQALRAFYAAIEDMVSGRGLDAMKEAWHHTNRVTTKHPFSDWALGWEEVWATWEIAAAFGRADRGGSQLGPVGVHVYGDIAYTTSVFQASPSWGGERLPCTNVLQRIDGVWKLIHHHADPGPGMSAALERMIQQNG
jgi:ketosteroid isomerase-like protein